MKYFDVSIDTYTAGFQHHVNINPLKSVESQLSRNRLDISTRDGFTSVYIRKIIEHNASLRVDFGWSFESEKHLTDIMDECLEVITPKYNPNVGRLVTDLRCSWLGFESHNMYDKEVYKDLSIVGLIIFNNEIVDFQTEVIKALTNHPSYIQHAFIRDSWFRFDSFKSIRKDRELLEEKFNYYMKAVRDVSMIRSLPRDILEQDIGVHFLHHPDLFFELLEFYILKGEVYE